ncbi:MAG: hypothetical protein S4CHLAM102_06670 [Chlamydiia bacterium]|nr:hypothetical protein [Chlamydiia bacterium]
MSVSAVMAKMDPVLDYIPGVSSISNCVALFNKCVVMPNPSCRLLASRYTEHLTQKSLLRCCMLLIPVLGNLLVAVYDIYSILIEKADKHQGTSNPHRQVLIEAVCNHQYGPGLMTEALKKDRGLPVALLEAYSKHMVEVIAIHAPNYHGVELIELFDEDFKYALPSVMDQTKASVKDVQYYESIRDAINACGEAVIAQVGVEKTAFAESVHEECEKLFPYVLTDGDMYNHFFSQGE